MARKAKRKLPKSVRLAMEARQKERQRAEAIDPMRTENPVLTRPPDLNRPAPKALPAPEGHVPTPEGIPYSAHQALKALPPPPSSQDAEDLLQQMGRQVLVGHEANEACTFWIDLKEEIFDGIRLRITLNPGRKVSARMLVLNRETEAFIRQRIPQLRTRLQRRGLFLDELEIIVP